MGLRTNPTQRQRRLGIELRRLRTSSGLPVGRAAAFADLGPAHLGHIEAARTAIPEVKLRALTKAYGCRSEPLIDALVAMSHATGKGWWTAYRDIQGPHTLDLAELEATAVACRSFQWLYMPGLLQSPEYIRALFESAEPHTDPELIEKYVQFRLHRQRALTDGSLRFHAVIHEAALRMHFVPADIMRRQVDYLVGMAQLPHVQVQILPFKASINPPTYSTPFVLFEGPVQELNTAYVEQPVASPFVSDPEHLTQFAHSFESLSSSALPPIDAKVEPEFHTRRDSLGLIQHLMYAI
ncbi:helix-turn-helix domain-containing protein [Streptomyces hesseae]|uniref:Helix-turn-helix transcriptional regulator n=1 Tax=Streptomyces hesseae TaxID=3075519 RepID=A0ABU2STP9_9ACTN|nr:helix-turn-helix transcriptional regulator [Streptomyces sp. DSM 40473]MDT0452387.1 helix-turn-helix transcriptional regulator [Streptomyces sp. DSM 40473]